MADRPFDFLLLEKALETSTANDTALALGLKRHTVMHFRAVGLDEDAARQLAEVGGFEPGDIWPELANGTAPTEVKPKPLPCSPPKPAKVTPPADDGDGIVWCDPPAPKRAAYGESHWELLLAPLIERPGEWARVRVLPDQKPAWNMTSALRSGNPKRARTPPGRWEFRSGEVEGTPPRYGVWARYLGPDDE